MSHLLIRFRVEKREKLEKTTTRYAMAMENACVCLRFHGKNNVASSFNAPRRWIKDSWWQPSSVVEATGPKTRRFGKGNIKEKDGKGWNDSRIWVLGTFFPFNLWITIHTNEGYWKYVKAPNCSKYIILHMGKGYAGFFPPSKWMNKTPTKVKSWVQWGIQQILERSHLNSWNKIILLEFGDFNHSPQEFIAPGLVTRTGFGRLRESLTCSALILVAAKSYFPHWESHQVSWDRQQKNIFQLKHGGNQPGSLCQEWPVVGGCVV